jgi:hypothetical protein
MNDSDTALRSKQGMSLALNCNCVVHNDPFPKVRALVHKLFVDWMLLVDILSRDVVEEQDLGCTVRGVYHGPLLG